MINDKVVLSVGASPAQRVVAVGFGLVFAVAGLAFVLLPLVADGLLPRLTGPADGWSSPGDVSGIPPELLPPELRDSAPGRGWWDNDRFGLGPARFIGLCGIPFVFIGLYVTLRAMRTAARLDGTRAQVRGALSTRTVDLSTAEITAGAITYRHNEHTSYENIQRVPTIIARDPGTGRQVTIPLQGPGMAMLPPHELRALAAAMTAGRSTEGRNGDVHTLAGQLRTMAENPLRL